MEDDLKLNKKWKMTQKNGRRPKQIFFFYPTRMMTSKINGRQPQTHKTNEDDLNKKIKKWKTTSKKST